MEKCASGLHLSQSYSTPHLSCNCRALFNKTAEEVNMWRRLKGKVIGLASCTIAGENECGLTITMFPTGKLKTDFIKKIGKDQKDFQQITKDDGDIVYHSLGGEEVEDSRFEGW